jgi:hypothetical protein
MANEYEVTKTNGFEADLADIVLDGEEETQDTVLDPYDNADNSTTLLAAEKYRNKVYRLSDELAGGVSQMQSNCRTWALDGARQEDNQELLTGIATYQPKGILVIGNTAELASDSQKRATLELFRRNLQNPEIITFDELLARAQYLVSHQQDTMESEA